MSDAVAPAGYDPSAYPPFAVTSDIVVLTIRGGELSVLLVERGNEPYAGCWALPGGFVDIDEAGEETARRELVEETGLEISSYHLEQLRTYSAPQRDPRMRVVSTAYLAFLPDLPAPVAGDDAARARFFAVRDIEAGEVTLAFDHDQILADAVERARSKIEYTTLAAAFVEKPFTLGDLRRVYECVWGTRLHPSNFARKVLSTPGFVRSLDVRGASQFEGGRVGALYETGNATVLHPAILRPTADEEDER